MHTKRKLSQVMSKSDKFIASCPYLFSLFRYTKVYVHCVGLGAADAGVKLVGDIEGVTGGTGDLKQVKDVVGISKDTVGLGKSAVGLGKVLSPASKDGKEGKEDKKGDKQGQAEKGLDIAEKGLGVGEAATNLFGDVAGSGDGITTVKDTVGLGKAGVELGKGLKDIKINRESDRNTEPNSDEGERVGGFLSWCNCM